MKSRDGRRRVVIFTFDGGQSLDVVGPLEVFCGIERSSGRVPYSIEVVAVAGGFVTTMSGLRLGVDGPIAEVAGPIDTLLIAGGNRRGIESVVGDADVMTHLSRTARSARRVASVCSGAFILAATGLLDGRRATTHWSACDALAQRFPKVRVEHDPIFVRDGRISTSAGVTAGIDLTLAFVEEDEGHDCAMAVAQQLVVFLKRPGGQSQFSAALTAQATDRDELSELQAWVADHLEDDLSVAALAGRAAMSPRHFARVFRAATGVTPARYVERARIEAARRRLVESDLGVDVVARQCGFGSAETMRRSFLRALQVAPTDYRRRFRTLATA